jgi:hypothetical protein
MVEHVAPRCLLQVYVPLAPWSREKLALEALKNKTTEKRQVHSDRKMTEKVQIYVRWMTFYERGKQLTLSPSELRELYNY